MRLIKFFITESIDIRIRLLVVYKTETFDLCSVGRWALPVKIGEVGKVVISNRD